MIRKLKKTIAFVGMMGAGKTAVGRAVAERLKIRFLDSDNEIETAANMSVEEIFIRDGEEFFRDREAEVIRRLFEYEKCVISTGGGAFINADVRSIMKDHALSVWLKADIDLLWLRVKNKENRPLLKTNDPFGSLKEIYDARQQIYALADLIVESEKDISIDAMADRVIDALVAREDVWEIEDAS